MNTALTPPTEHDPPPPRTVILAQLGDRAALERLLLHTRPWLSRCLVRMLGESDAPDAVQEVMFIVARRLALLDEPRAYRAWVYRIATRHAFRVLSGRKRHGTLDERFSEAEAPEMTPPDREEIDRLRDHVAELPPNSLTVIVLHYGEGLSIARVSDVLGVPEGTVKSRLNTALSALRRLMKDARP